jgi:molybdenum cofactor cytidylyltransferase
VLAAGGSKRLGQAKQLLPYGGAPLLGHVLQTARSCPFDQLLCVVGGASTEVRRWVDLRAVQLVENEAYGDGCSSSIVAALEHVDERCDVLVLMLGDKGVWKLMDRYPDEVVDVPMDGPIPLDVDTWDDYRRVLLGAGGV